MYVYGIGISSEILSEAGSAQIGHVDTNYIISHISVLELSISIQ